jgi:Patatin phospholipase
MWEVLHRQKDIQYSSRIASHMTRQQQTHRLRHVVSQLVRYLPDDVRKSATMRALVQAPWQGDFDPIEGVILHESMPDLAIAAE